MAERPGASASGIITDDTGERHIPESRRADGTTRQAIKIRPGYRPPEDVEVYKNQTAESFRQRGKGPPPGSESLAADGPRTGAAANNKNAKRREARKKAKSASEDVHADGKAKTAEPRAGDVDPELDRQRRVRKLRKTLKQARELQDKREMGESLLPEQVAKVIKINDLIGELEGLGIREEGEAKANEVQVLRQSDGE